VAKRLTVRDDGRRSAYPARMRAVSPPLRTDLQAVRVISLETAEAIMLYAVRLPTFVVDAYARRIFERLGKHHSLLVRHGHEVCVARYPHCDSCPLRPLCANAMPTQTRSPIRYRKRQTD